MGHVHRVAASLLVLAGCRAVFGLDDPLPGDPGGPVDAPAADMPADAVALCNTNGLTCAGNKIAYACGDTCWVGCDDNVSHNTANTRCDGWGGKLAPFVSMNDQDCFRQYVQPNDDSWTGLEQMTGAGSTAAGWSWNSNGLTPPFFNWATGQPNDGDGTEDGTEQCAQIVDGTNKWQDVPCTATFEFACAAHIDD